jgi:DNA-binding MarR family transcriptional regulator
MRGRAIWCRLWRLRRAKWDPAERELRKAGVPTEDHYETLRFLSQTDLGVTPMTRLREAMCKPQYATSRIVGRLERDGLVRKTVSEIDHRTRLVAITDHGRVVAARVWDAYRSSLRNLLGGEFRDDDLLSLEALLRRIEMGLNSS